MRRITVKVTLDPDKLSHALLLRALGGSPSSERIRRLALGGLALEQSGRLEEAVDELIAGVLERIDSSGDRVIMVARKREAFDQNPERLSPFETMHSEDAAVDAVATPSDRGGRRKLVAL